MRDAVAIIREAQEVLHGSAKPYAGELIGELDRVASALQVLPDLHLQAQRRYEVLFPSAFRESSDGGRDA